MLPHAPLHGQIVSASGNSVAGARVYVYSLVVETKDRTCFLRGDDETHSAKDGSFTLPAIPHGLIELWVERQGYAAKRFNVRTPVPSVKIVLDQGATFRGRVLAPDGVAIESCEVWLEFDPYSLHNATCTPQGFLLKYLSPGDAILRVDIKAGSVLGLRSLSKKVHIEPNQQPQEDIRWPAGETISGEVVTTAGDPVSGIWIQALPRGTENLLNRIYPDSVRVQTDAYGRFTFWHLSPGSWVLSFYGIETTQEARTGEIDVRLVKRMN